MPRGPDAMRARYHAGPIPRGPDTARALTRAIYTASILYADTIKTDRVIADRIVVREWSAARPGSEPHRGAGKLPTARPVRPNARTAPCPATRAPAQPDALAGQGGTLSSCIPGGVVDQIGPARAAL